MRPAARSGCLPAGHDIADTALSARARCKSQLAVARCRSVDTGARPRAVGDLLTASEVSAHFTLWHWIWNALRFQ